MEAATFEPTMLTIAPGDSVRFVPATPGHNAQTIRGMLPEGAEPIAVPVDTETVITFTVEGIYGYRCAPHYGMGMVGIIQVGAPVNEAAAKAVTHQGMAAEVFTELLGNH
jgi:pseudoazurin